MTSFGSDCITPVMASVENGIIKFSKEEAKIAKKHACPKCDLGFVCRGPDSKTNTAEIHPSIAHNPTDVDVVASAACMQKINV